jgi:5-methylcytosine-specific restriction endonuclease McrA
MDAHRQWLINRYGPVCAYCGADIAEDRTTLDHVYPRKGQTAYDRPDNLVIACQPCNSAKADTPFIAFIAQKRSRGVFLLHYGEHLSDWVKDLIRQASAREFLPSNKPVFVPHRNGYENGNGLLGA